VCLTIQILVVGFLLTQAYSARDFMAGFALAVPPVLGILALYCGPDKEERQLRTQLTKARMRKELRELEEQSKG
jgi:hypothetical protein